MAKLSNEQVVNLIHEKMKEKEEVIREQQMQIQELQERISELEARIPELEKAEKERDDLIEKLSQVLE
jgi:prefoldin subunit 5